MQFLDKIKKVFSQKLQTSQQNLRSNIQNILLNGSSSDRLASKSGDIIKERSLKQVNTIMNYFLSEKRTKSYLQNLIQTIGQKQQQCVQQLKGQFPRIQLFKTQTVSGSMVADQPSYEQSLVYQQNQQIQEQNEIYQPSYQEGLVNQQNQDENMIDQPEQSEQNRELVEKLQLQQDEQSKMVKIDGFIEKQNEVDLGNDKKEEKKERVNYLQRQIRSDIFVRDTDAKTEENINPQNIGKKDIVKDLERRREQIYQKESKSKKMRSRIVKMEPLASKKQAEQAEKQAKRKLQQAFEFIHSIQITRKNSDFKRSSEWKQQKIVKKDNQNEVKIKIRDSNRRKLLQLGFIVQNSSSTIEPSRSKNQRVLPKIDRPYTLTKPVPYNIYNVYQSKQQLFKLVLP